MKLFHWGSLQYAILIFLLAVAVVMISFLLTILIGSAWTPTPKSVVGKMLKIAGLKRGETLYDLGSGDGRIVIKAAKDFGAVSVGIEANPFLVIWSRLKIKLLRLEKRAKIIWGNFFNLDLSAADVVTIFLSQRANDELREKFSRELKSGARVVSYTWIMKGWTPVKVDLGSEIYVYKVSEVKKAEKIPSARPL
jgi:predicted RNA methylase